MSPHVASLPSGAVSRASGPLGAPRDILILRALQLGDLLCIVPALRALRAAFPRARITLAGLPWAREFADRFQRYVDAFAEFPGLPGLPERECDVARVADFLRAMQARRFDLALQLHGDGRLLNVVTKLLGSGRCAGFYRPGAYCPEPERFVQWRDGEHEILRYLRLLRELGVPPQGTELEFPVRTQDEDAWQEIVRRFRIEDGLVCMHPGAQLPSRRWHPERFAAVADRLARRGHPIVLTGTAGERALTHAVAARMRERALDLSGKTSLGALAMLLGSAALVICNDTGVSHVAAAMRTPSVVVCCGADAARWAPLDGERHRVFAHDVACRPCAFAACPYGHPCAEGVRVEEVAAQAELLLRRYPWKGRTEAGSCVD